MDSQFWKLFGTLFGIGAAVSFVKGMKSKKKAKEVVSEMIITGFLATTAGLIYIWFPTVNVVAVIAAASLLSILGVAFFGEKIEEVFDRVMDKYFPKDK